MAKIKQLTDFETLVTQVLTNLRQNRPVTIEPSDLNIAAFDAVVPVLVAEQKRRQATGRPKVKDASRETARMRQYRKTGSTVGWENELKIDSQ